MANFQTTQFRHKPLRGNLGRLVIGLLLASACDAPIGISLPNVLGDGGGNDDGGGGIPGGPGTVIGPDGRVLRSAVPPSSRVARLTHQQWEFAARDLLLTDDTGVSGDFFGDPLSAGFDNNASSLRVGAELVYDYQQAAETMAAALVADVDWYASVVPEDPRDNTVPGSARDAWILRFVSKAARRPASVDEIAAYTALFVQGPTAVESGSDFADGVRLVVAAVLQSPLFIYRIDGSTEPDATGWVPLNGYELASRLSFTLWDEPPDDVLLDLAESGALSEHATLRAQAERMVDDPRMLRSVLSFHRQLLGIDAYGNISKPSFAAWSASLPASMQQEALLFVQHQFTDGGTVGDLFTSTTTYVDSALAAVYGVPAPAADWDAVELDGSQRAGLLTMAGFLALYSNGETSNPIQRGVHLAHELLCLNVPAQPNEVPALPPALEGEALTMRQRVEAHTEQPGTSCQSCHAGPLGPINPPGFALEHFDGLGQYRTTDNGVPIDASSLLNFDVDGVVVEWADVPEFGRKIADSLQAHHCYSEHLLSYYLSRALTEEDGDNAMILAVGALDERKSLRTLVIDSVMSAPFRYRSVEAE